MEMWTKDRNLGPRQTTPRPNSDRLEGLNTEGVDEKMPGDMGAGWSMRSGNRSLKWRSSNARDS